MQIKEIKEIIAAIDKSSISKFDVEIDGFKMSIEKEMKTNNNAKILPENEQVKTDERIYIKEDFGSEELDNNKTDDLYEIKAPLIGTYYSSPNTNLPEYVKIGTKVKKGDTLCILEAMKLMNEIQSDVDGEIVEIIAKNEDLVEYNQTLFKVKVD